MSLVNIFKSNLFRTTTLTAAINAEETPVQRIAELGIFTEDGVSTTSVVIERKNSTLSIAPAKPRGADPTPMRDPNRDAVAFEIPHVPVRDSLLADELQNVRAFGSEDDTEGVESTRDERLNRMNVVLDNTEEFHRLGAIQGLVLDADGSVMFDLFDEFEVPEPASIDLDLDAPWAAEQGGVIRAQLTGISSRMRQILGNKRVTGVWAPCGEELFSKLTNHPEVRQTYLNTQEAKDLRGGPIDESFVYGGVLWELYPGYGEVEMKADECRFIPMGVQDLFISRYAPAPWFSAVNRKGLPRYAMATLDPTGEKRIDMEAQMNGLHICTRPEVLIPGRLV
ncbi:major capsid protein [uncultured Brevundimonas sp.]|uniref:major capsid protein n=1 Tax=uncultured Brevundimonas sp. TaxID=213418 RepID=UPI0025CE11D3|nr:major capsid protein [uncultured Brevundimonas sp.]